MNRNDIIEQILITAVNGWMSYEEILKDLLKLTPVTVLDVYNEYLIRKVEKM